MKIKQKVSTSEGQKLYKETIRDEEQLNAENYAKTIQEIDTQTTKPKNTTKKEHIFFKHPLKTMNVELHSIEGRGFKHLQEEQKESIDKKIIQEMPVIKTENFDSFSIKEDAPTLKEIESHMGKLDLQK